MTAIGNGQSVPQSDGFTCGVHTVFNALALVQQQEQALQSVNPKAL